MRRLAGWRHVLCAAPAYLETHPAPAAPADLARHNCLRDALYPFGDEWHFTAADGKPAHVRVSGNLLTTSGEVLRRVALRGGGLALLPPFVAADDLAAGALVPLLPEYRPAGFAISAIYPHRRHLPAKVRAFLDALAARFARYQRWLDPAA